MDDDTKDKHPDPESVKAAASLFRLAQAQSLLRRFRESRGYKATSLEELSAWARTIRLKIEPSDDDYQVVERQHPDLVLLARRSLGEQN